MKTTTKNLHFALAGLFVLLLASSAAGIQFQTFLPEQFAGWKKQPPALASNQPKDADAANAALLKEYGFELVETATYARNGRKLQIRAARFVDATGAYGAYTSYLQPNMHVENALGNAGASEGPHIMFYRGPFLIDATFEQTSAMSAADLRELAALLPVPQGAAHEPPTLPTKLPTEGKIDNSERLVLGPAGLSKVGAPLSAAEVNFSYSPEIAFARYETAMGIANMTLIHYPTPQMAIERERALIESRAKVTTDGERFFVRRSGPWLMVVAGEVSPPAADTLLQSVNYVADVTWNEENPEKALPNEFWYKIRAIVFALVIVAMAIGAGIVFGGFRLLMKKLYPDKVFDRKEDVEIIRLGIVEEPGDGRKN